MRRKSLNCQILFIIYLKLFFVSAANLREIVVWVKRTRDQTDTRLGPGYGFAFTHATSTDLFGPNGYAFLAAETI